MKNYLLFIIDSLNYSHVKESSTNLMPFLRKLEEAGISCENMYSQAPYTEAAVMNIYCGQDVLQNGGYLHRFKNAPLTIFEAMKEKGYTTYFNSYQPQCHPSSVRRGVDHIFYNVGFDQGALWSYRLSHFAEVYRKGTLTEKDYAALYETMDDNFREWLRFIDDVLSSDASVSMISGNALDYDACAVKKLVLQQYEDYKVDPKSYLHGLFLQGTAHPFFKIPAYVQNGKIKDRTVIPQIQSQFRPLFKRIQRMNLCLNLKNGTGLLRGPAHKFGEFLKKPGMGSAKNFAKSMLLSVNTLRDLDLFDRLNRCDRFKNAPSGRTHIDHYIAWAKARPTDEKHFACIHIDDIHNPEEFFTYDSSDMELLRKEFEIASELLNQIPDSYHGNLTHDLSLRYMDTVIEYLYSQMEANELLEDTCILICADHGFSFSGNPLRDSFVINLYLENYNIPCVITGTGLEPLKIKNLCSSKDIPATLCHLADGNVPDAFSGNSILKAPCYDHVQIEYCGGGCPDISRRELKMAEFNERYFVGTLGTLKDDLKITEIYDLQKDPQQTQNLVNAAFDQTVLDELRSHILHRRKEIEETMV